MAGNILGTTVYYDADCNLDKLTGKKKEILTDKILSEMFKMPVKVVWESERPWLIVR